ncbi:hypothetical protein [Stomatobaculum longum]|jgi:hypothetical protein|uniref:hypothetical protein n=1 Tax=Stomatobaculum longum TaxID=796942 RepID=UPI000594C128|nr:hypothetical protein [Stomatobaculum longum]
MGTKKEPAKRICMKPEDVHNISSGQLPFCRLLFTFLSRTAGASFSLRAQPGHIDMPNRIVQLLAKTLDFLRPAPPYRLFTPVASVLHFQCKLQFFSRDRRPVQQRPQKISLYEIVLNA